MWYIWCMRKENLHNPYDISFVTASVCAKLEHGHNFFELAYIRSGTGRHILNYSSTVYHTGQLYLITPDDTHHFEIDTETEFLFLKFNHIFLKKSNFGTDSLKHLEYILQNANRHHGCILKNYADKDFVKPLVEAIHREVTASDFYNEDLIRQLVYTLVIIVARNIAKFLPVYVADTTEEKVVGILQYIEQNIYDPKKLRAEHISDMFTVSTSYVGRYFKKHTNDTLQGYISKYKVNLIEHRIKYSDKRINEIANEFGFTDVSHLNKFFKKQKGYSLRDVKRGV